MYLFEDAMRTLTEMKWAMTKFESRNKASEGNCTAFNFSDPIDVTEIM